MRTEVLETANCEARRSGPADGNLISYEEFCELLGESGSYEEFCELFVGAECSRTDVSLPECTAVSDIQETVTNTRVAAGRPYGLLGVIEYFYGPIPDESDETRMQLYRQDAQGLYKKLQRPKKIQVKDGNWKCKTVTTMVEINRQWWFRKMRSGLTVFEADELACAIGVHPSAIWPTWFEDSLGEMRLLKDDDWDRIEAVDARREKARQISLNIAARSAALEDVESWRIWKKLA